MIETLAISRRITYDHRGYVSCGKQVDGNPIALDHWDTTDFTEVVRIYGRTPSTITVYLPDEDWTMVFDDRFARWVKSKSGKPGTCKRFCNGRTCTHRIDETIAGRRYAASSTSPCVCTELDEDDTQRCVYELILTAYIAHPGTLQLIAPIVYPFRSHSMISGHAARSEFEKMRLATGRGLIGIPFNLTVRQAERRDIAGRRFPIWDISVHESYIERSIAGLLDEPATTDRCDTPVRQSAAEDGPRETAMDVLSALESQNQDRAALIERIEAIGKRIGGERWTPAAKKTLALSASKRADGVAGLDNLTIEELRSVLAQLEAGAHKRGIDIRSAA